MLVSENSANVLNEWPLIRFSHVFCKIFSWRYELRCYFRFQKRNENYILAQTKTCLCLSLSVRPEPTFLGICSLVIFAVLHGNKNLKTEKSGRKGFSRKILVCPKICKRAQDRVFLLFLKLCHYFLREVT